MVRPEDRHVSNSTTDKPLSYMPPPDRKPFFQAKTCEHSPSYPFSVGADVPIAHSDKTMPNAHEVGVLQCKMIGERTPLLAKSLCFCTLNGNR